MDFSDRRLRTVLMTLLAVLLLIAVPAYCAIERSGVDEKLPSGTEEAMPF